MKSFKEFLKENQEPLCEIATVCPKKGGYGFIFILKIYSNDHEPAHMHMIDLGGVEITRIMLTNKKPSKINDIVEYPKDPIIDNDLKRKVSEWSKSKSKTDINNWIRAIDFWNTYQED